MYFATSLKIVLTFSVGTLALFTSLAAGLVHAQSKTDPPIDAAAVRYGAPVKTIWEFGLQLTPTADAKVISATVPVPMDYPEQTITIDAERKSEGVGKLKYSNPTKLTKQLTFKINQLAGGKTGYAVIRVHVVKRMIIAPRDPSVLQLAKKVPSKLKTYLKPSPYIESKHKQIKAIAKELTDDSLSGWEQVETVYKWVRENVEYEFDTEIHTCLEALESKKGDCEELSSLFIAICRAMDIPARAVWIPGHTYPEFYLEDENGNGHWFPCQAAGEYEFGSMTETKPVLQKGDRFRIPGQQGLVRYVQPTVSAKDLSGGIEIDWVSRLRGDGDDGKRRPRKPNESGK